MTDQPPAQRMAEIEARFRRLGNTVYYMPEDMQFLIDRCRKLADENEELVLKLKDLSGNDAASILFEQLAIARSELASLRIELAYFRSTKCLHPRAFDKPASPGRYHQCPDCYASWHMSETPP